MIKKVIVILVLISSFDVFAARRDPNAEIQFVIRNDKAGAVYKLNEQAIFNIQVLHNGANINAGLVSVRFSYDDGAEVLKEQRYQLSGTLLRVRGVLDKPGFLRCDVSYSHNGKTFSDRGAAAYEPEKLTAVAEEPTDFDSFWTSGRRQLANIPVDPQIKLITAAELGHDLATRKEFLENSEHSNNYQISFSNLDNTRIYGLLSVPKNIEGPYPVHVTIASAGVGKPDRPFSYLSSHKGVMVLQMSVHDAPLLQQDLVYKKLSEGRLKFYQHQGKPDREQYYLRKVILGLDRAITYMVNRPDYNKKNLVVYGGSQGGGLTLVMTGLNNNVTAAISRVPGLCDHSGMLAGRRSGWPGIARHIGSKEERSPYLQMAKYYDAVYFAKRIDVPILMNVGFIDDTCAPSGQYCAFNVINTTDKKIHNDPILGHFKQSAEFLKLKGDFLNKHLGIK